MNRWDRLLAATADVSVSTKEAPTDEVNERVNRRGLRAQGRRRRAPRAQDRRRPRRRHKGAIRDDARWRCCPAGKEPLNRAAPSPWRSAGGAALASPYIAPAACDETRPRQEGPPRTPGRERVSERAPRPLHARIASGASGPPATAAAATSHARSQHSEEVRSGQPASSARPHHVALAMLQEPPLVVDAPLREVPRSNCRRDSF